MEKKIHLRISRYFDHSYSERIDVALRAFENFPAPWNFVAPKRIAPSEESGNWLFWAFRGKLGRGVSGRLQLLTRVGQVHFRDTECDLLNLEWNNTDFPHRELVDLLPSFIEEFCPKDLFLGWSLRTPHWDWKDFQERYFPDQCEMMPSGYVALIGIANYWCEELCQVAFQKTPEELKSRLEGHALRLEIIHGGLFSVFAERPTTEQDALDLNRRIRPLVGGFGLFSPPSWYRPEVAPEEPKNVRSD